MAILATIFTASMLLIVAALAHLLILQEDPAWAEQTGLAWTILVIGSLIGIMIGPEFMHYTGQRGLLKEVLSTDIRSEVERQRGDAEAAARLLGSPAEARLNEHFSNLGMKKMRR